MDATTILIVIGLVHCSLFFFDTIFKSCSHYPYLYFLRNTGLEVQILRLKWFTTAFNRKILKWGMDRSRFWSAWFSTGVIVSLVLLPFAVLATLKTVLVIWSQGSSVTSNSEAILEPMVPGIDIPFNEIGYYAITLGICGIVHELGHALAAAREDVQLYGVGLLLVYAIPMFYTHMNKEQLKALPLRNQLRVACAGIWHNVVLAIIAAALLIFGAWLWAPFYAVGSGVYVKSISPNSPVVGPTGLNEKDLIYELNECPIKDSEDWYNCVLHAVNHAAPGYCVKQSFIQEYDESVPSKQKTNGVINCCTSSSEESGSLCFEYIEGSQTALHLPPYSCLPARSLINQSQNLCHSSHECTTKDTHCLKPSLDNVTKIIQIKRRPGKDVLYFGHPVYMYRSVHVTDWVPKYSLLKPKLPEAFALLCKYITVFSAGLAVINVVPYFFLDGHYILDILVLCSSTFLPHSKSVRHTVVSTVTGVTTLLLTISVLYLFANKLT